METANLTWNFKPLFESDNDPKIQQNLDLCLEKAKEFSQKWSERQDYLNSSDVLKMALNDYLEYEEEYGSFSASYYLSLRQDQEQSNTELRAKNQKADGILQEVSNLLQFFPIRLSKASQTFQVEVLANPIFAEFKHFLYRLFQEAKYVLSEDAEKVLTIQRNISLSNWVQMTDKFLNEEEVNLIINDSQKTVSFNQLFDLISSPDKNLRKISVEALNSILNKHINVAESELNSVLEYRKNIDKLRGYTRPDESRHISDDVPTEVVDALIQGVTENFQIARDYYQLKTQLFGQEKLAYHERNIPYGQLSKQYTWDEAVGLVSGVFSKLSPKFLVIFENMLKNGQFDVYPRSGKSGGAYCTSGTDKIPVYVLLNHTNTLNNVLTLAHEMGHAIHHHLYNENQNALNRQSSMFTAEVSSTFMEDFVLESILETADDELRLAIMMNKLNDDVSTIFRQTACYNFETELHKSFREKGYLSKQEIGEIFRKEMANYMSDFVSQDEGSQNWWVYWSHIRNFFYVYSYSSGLLISKAMQANFKKDKNYIEKVKQFMSAGTSKSSVELFADLGIDVTNEKFWSESTQSTARLLEETKQLAKKLGKI